MTSRERFIATVERRTVDRPACWVGMPDGASLPALYEYFGASDMAGFKAALDDDVYPIEPPYESETASAIYAAFDWYSRGNVDKVNRTLTTPGFFADSEDVSEVDEFDWPEPAKYMDPAEIERRFSLLPKDKASVGMMWSAHFQDTCAAFGMNNCFMNMIDNPELVHAVNDRIVDFYLKANEIFYKAARGRLDSVIIGNDMGTQRGLMLSPELIEEFVLPGCRMLTKQAHDYGIKVIYHSCGSIVPIIDMLINAGVDAIHPIQAKAAGMSAEELKERFDGAVSFAGGMDTQELLVNGPAEAIKQRVRELRRLFPTGLVISPSHEAVLPDIPPRHIAAMFEAAKEA
ncbi:MAG: methyltransferase [Clostridia bacterium]|nr:methyltransferase [Clostridia bacterium]